MALSTESGFGASDISPKQQGSVMTDFPFPLRKDAMAVLRLPSDITESEVKKLITFLKSIVV